LLLDGFEPTSTAGPLRMAPGSYVVDIREVGASAGSPPVLSAVLPVSAGPNMSILAHLTRVGDPTLSVFRNSFERLSAGRSLLQVRHGAAAPPLSVRLDDRRVKEGLRQGDKWGIATDPGRNMISFESETSDDVLISPTDIRLEEGVVQIVYVIGSAEGDSLDLMLLMLQSVRGLRSGRLLFAVPSDRPPDIRERGPPEALVRSDGARDARARDLRRAILRSDGRYEENVVAYAVPQG
jgi:hypothetical protein